MLIGLAGAYLPMVYTGTFTDLMVKGRGWIAIALTFLARGARCRSCSVHSSSPPLKCFPSAFQVGSAIIPYQFLTMLPYIATIIVMIFTLASLVFPPSWVRTTTGKEERL